MNEIKEQQNKVVKSSGQRRRFSFGRWWQEKTGEPLKTSEKILAAVFVFIFLFVFYVALDANKYVAQVRVVEGEGRVGVNPTTELLDFGDLSRGATVIRRVELQNGTFMPIFVVVVKTGSIADLIDIDENYFELKPGEETKIEFKNFIPASAEVGRVYNGRVYLFKIPTFGLS